MSRLIWLGIVLVFLGSVLAVVGWQERGLAAAASEKPEEISLKDLIARGPEGNPHVILRDFELCNGDYVVEEHYGHWTKIWVPIVPTDPNNPDAEPPEHPTNIRALLFSVNVANEADIANRLDQPRIQALVTNRITSLGSEERRLLESKYPGTDFKSCLIIQEGREPAGLVKLILMIGGGGFLALAGCGLIGILLVRSRRDAARRTSSRRSKGDEGIEEHGAID